MNRRNPYVRVRINSLLDYLVLKFFPNALMVMIPQSSPNHIEPIDDNKIKPKNFIKSGIGGEFLFQQETPTPPGTKLVIHKKPGQQRYRDPHGV